MKRSILLLSLLNCVSSNNYIYATELGLYPMNDNYLRVTPSVVSLNQNSDHLDGIVVSLSKEELLKNNFHILGNISYDLDLSEQIMTSEELKSLHPYAEMITGLDLSDNFITDLDHITAFTKLKNLNLSNNRFSDTGLQFIGNLYSLSDLNLYHTKVTHVGITKLEYLKNLKKLNVSCNNLGKFGSKVILENIPSLTNLEIRGCGLDNTSLDYFLEMPYLKNLDISSNKSINSKELKEFISQAEKKEIKVLAANIF